ncbi:MAG: SUMF1/EgtB/PvdO family nonheme iron enzyme [Deferribacteres bacterium]|nr:SUMF1/EgtB/PvdO family nonheme iron enzyme [candidate division KSB1 bacterium]MCB9510468.1 SUMF1/EgtB/PvdO family nonheme iron enzyme [Deferribacteres bacterium]
MPNPAIPPFGPFCLRLSTDQHILIRAAVAGTNRVIRGGSWNNDAQNCRPANRNGDNPDNRDNNLGFRLVFVP